MNSEHKSIPGSIIHLVEHTVVQMTLPEEMFHSISVHVTLVSTLYTCFVDYSNIIPHIYLSNPITHFQLVVHLIHMWY